ncbi:hypothetical protein AN964_16495 [Heyndrickxia shackletonii]|uniref:Uncharacterized protein n=1 Tax=Heyndrickxia shackletonii TaxID=157838 RepID=A0A0Q3WZC2_9BACI|nr:hypothetical protein [Heyndrickxia shackletonii]KQL54941.1 hypothetical protein AN964_16495 [Heyndrickxia shackletonii]NEZ01348.1 hypothetical protein [Heyndrickxia shackletonii]
MNFVLGFFVNWTAIGAIASAIASTAALITIIISIKQSKNKDKEKHYGAQPWFHATSIERMGEKAPVKIIVLNDATPTIKIDKVEMIVKESQEIIELKYKYLKKSDRFIETGKCFGIEIPNKVSLFGRVAFIEIHFTNLYKKSMVASSPEFEFYDREGMDTLLYIKKEGFLYKPFSNSIK